MSQPLFSSWTLCEAQDLVRDMAYDLAREGMHLALAGSVLKHGESEHDLDLVVFPHKQQAGCDVRALWTVLRTWGWEQHRTVEEMHAHWANIAERAARRQVTNILDSRCTPDTKHVEVWRTSAGKRVDLIVMYPVTSSVAP